MDHSFTRRGALSLGAAAWGVLALSRSASAIGSPDAEVVDEPSPYEARFPDIIKLSSGGMMAVWHRATAHANAVGTIRMAFAGSQGLTWQTSTRALPAGDLEGIDTRDPKLGRMNDGSIVMTFFAVTPAGNRVHYAVWKPGWPSFSAARPLQLPGISGSTACHGGAIALADNGTFIDQVLIPFYVGGSAGGAYYARATWRPVQQERLVVESAANVHPILVNAEVAGRTYSEPSFVQIGAQMVGVVRSKQGDDAIAARIVRWDPYTASPSYTRQVWTGVIASSHHLLKTSDGKVLFTYGDGALPSRPTKGILVSSPGSAWPASPRTALIYNSGAEDQANPSSAETGPGQYITLAYNAKSETAAPGTGGTLWVVKSTASDYM